MHHSKKKKNTVICIFLYGKIDHAFMRQCCDSLFICLSKLSLGCPLIFFFSMKNAAASLLTRSSRMVYMRLYFLHWLPVKYRIDFKVFVFYII